MRNLLQNAFPTGPLFSTHILSLETVLTVVEMIERNCAAKQQKRIEMNDKNVMEEKEDKTDENVKYSKLNIIK